MWRIPSTGVRCVPTTQVSTCDAKSICTIKLQGLCWQAWIGQARLALTGLECGRQFHLDPVEICKDLVPRPVLLLDHRDAILSLSHPSLGGQEVTG